MAIIKVIASVPPKRHGLAWSDDEDAVLRMLARRGESPDWVARQLQRSPEATVHRFELLDNPHRQAKLDARRAQRNAGPEAFVRWPKPSKTFTNGRPNKCAVCAERITTGASAHFVAADKVAHATCF